MKYESCFPFAMSALVTFSVFFFVYFFVCPFVNTYVYNSARVRSFYGEQKPSIKPEAARRGFYARFLFAIETENEGAIVLSIFSKISTKTSPKTFLFCEERQKLYWLVGATTILLRTSVL